MVKVQMFLFCQVDSPLRTPATSSPFRKDGVRPNEAEDQGAKTWKINGHLAMGQKENPPGPEVLGELFPFSNRFFCGYPVFFDP